MRIEDINPPDVTAIEMAMSEFMGGCADSHQPQAKEVHAAFCRFVDDYRRLDSWVRRAKRCQTYMPMEPVMYKGEAGVVLAVTPNRVACRLWRVPRHGVSDRPKFEVRRVNPDHLSKISTDGAFGKWVEMMTRAGLCQEDVSEVLNG